MTGVANVSPETVFIMRIVLLLTILTVSGCQLARSGADCQPVAEEQQCTDKRCADRKCSDQCRGECRTCSHKSKASELFCTMTLGCFGKHPKYCRFHDNVLTRHDARKLAHQELSRSYGSDRMTCDFRRGYEQAFVDVAQGGWGEVPALPPANYWTNCARTPEGHEKAHDWFSGYSAGAEAAKAMYEPYNKVAASQFYDGSWERGSDNYRTQSSEHRSDLGTAH